MDNLKRQLQTLLKTCGRSMNSIAVQAKLNPVQLHRLYHWDGKPNSLGVGLDVMERVADALGYRIVLVPNKAARTLKKPTTKGR